MIKGQEDYENIPIPNDLTKLRSDAKKRAEKHKKNILYLKCISTAAVFALVFLLCNVQTTYAALVKVPVLGRLVQVLNIGSGGTITDGVTVYTEADNEILTLQFTKYQETTSSAPAYEIKYYQAPDRIVVTLNGVREFDREEFQQRIKKIKSIRYAYAEIVLDDSMIRLVLELEDGMDYMAEEFTDPGTLNITFTQAEEKEEDIYYVRTSSMKMGEPLALLAEDYPSFETTIVRTKQDLYCLVLGYRKTKEEAEELLRTIQDKQITGTEIFVEQGKTNQNPR